MKYNSIFEQFWNESSNKDSKVMIKQEFENRKDGVNTHVVDRHINIDITTPYGRPAIKSENGSLSRENCRYLKQSFTNTLNQSKMIAPKTKIPINLHNLRNNSSTLSQNQRLEENSSSLGVSSSYPLHKRQKVENIGLDFVAFSNSASSYSKPFESRVCINPSSSPVSIPEGYTTFRNNTTNGKQKCYLQSVKKETFKENDSCLLESSYLTSNNKKRLNLELESVASSDYDNPSIESPKSKALTNSSPNAMVIPEGFFTPWNNASNYTQNGSEYFIPKMQPFEVPELTELYFRDILNVIDSPPVSPLLETVSISPSSSFPDDKNQAKFGTANAQCHFRQFEVLPDTPYSIYRNSGGTLACTSCSEKQIKQWTIICGVDDTHIFCFYCVKRYILTYHIHYCPSGQFCRLGNSQFPWQISSEHLSFIFQE